MSKDKMTRGEFVDEIIKRENLEGISPEGLAQVMLNMKSHLYLDIEMIDQLVSGLQDSNHAINVILKLSEDNGNNLTHKQRHELLWIKGLLRLLLAGIIVDVKISNDERFNIRSFEGLGLTKENAEDKGVKLTIEQVARRLEDESDEINKELQVLSALIEKEENGETIKSEYNGDEKLG